MRTKCISCGSHVVFFKYLCKRCYLKNHPILKQKKAIYITICTLCELLSMNQRWTNFYLSDLGTPSLNSALSSFLIQQWDFYYKPKNYKFLRIELIRDSSNLISAIKGVIEFEASPDVFVPPITVSEEFEIDVNWGECTECQKRLSGSYKSKIQVRTLKVVEKTQLERWRTEIENLSRLYPMSDGKNPLFKITYLKSGIDALFQSKSVANSVGRIFAKNNAGLISVTTEFAGFDKSKSKEYPRIPVVLINIPPFNPSDFVLYNNQPVQIHNFIDSKVEFWDFTKKEWIKIPIKSFMDAKPEIIDEEFRKFQIINFEEDSNMVQIMDVDSFETFFIDSSDMHNFSEGEIVSGIFRNGILLMQKKRLNNLISKDGLF